MFVASAVCDSRPHTPAGDEVTFEEHEIGVQTSSTKTAAVAACKRFHAFLPACSNLWVDGSVFG